MPNPNQAKENPRIKEILRALGHTIGKALPKGWGFGLMLFEFEKHSLFYTSNVKKEDIIQIMKEFVEREEQA